MVTRSMKWIASVVAFVVLLLTSTLLVSAQTQVVDQSVTEGNSDSQTFQVRVTGPFSEQTFIPYSTRDGSATAADGDYEPMIDYQLYCPIGDGCPAMFIWVTVYGDTQVEPNETFYLDVEGVGTGAITILNDDVEVIEEPMDTTPPVVLTPGTQYAEATGPGGAAVSYSISATDESPLNPVVSCDWESGSVFPIGTTTVSCSATDDAGNTGYGSFDVVVQDTTAPELTLPGDITVDATGLEGAVVPFTASASDLVDGDVAVDCVPASDSTFAIGSTQVSCSATDSNGNTANGGFLVTVRGAEEQLGDLTGMVQNLSGANGGIKNSLTVKLDNVAQSLAQGDITTACNQLNAFTNQVQAQSGKHLTVAEADLLLTNAARVQAVMGC